MPKVKSAPSISKGTTQLGGNYSGFSPVPITISLSEKDKGKGKAKQPIHAVWIREHINKGGKTAKTKPVVNQSSIALEKATLAESEQSTTDHLPAHRTLFIANLPIDATEDAIRTMFKEYGAIERVVFKVSDVGKNELQVWAEDSDDEDEAEDLSDSDAEENDTMKTPSAPKPVRSNPPNPDGKKNRHGRKNKNSQVPQIVPLPNLYPRTQPFLMPSSSAYLIYLSPLSLKRALEVAPTRSALPITVSKSETGLTYYTKLHNTLRPSPESLKAHADSALALYDYYTIRQKQKVSQGAIVDDDGFTLVVRGGKFGRTAGTGSAGVAVASRRFVLDSKKAVGKLLTGDGNRDGEQFGVDAREGLERGKKRKNKLELDGFYRFQKHEEKRQGLAELRRAFADDQAKVADLKAQRRFRPY